MKRIPPNRQVNTVKPEIPLNPLFVSFHTAFAHGFADVAMMVFIDHLPASCPPQSMSRSLRFLAALLATATLTLPVGADAHVVSASFEARLTIVATCSVSAGADLYIVKPFSPIELIDAVTGLLADIPENTA